MEIRKMKDMTEVEQKIWKEEENGAEDRKGNIPEGWRSEEKRSNNLLVKMHWNRLRKSREQIEKGEEWKCPTWLERPSQEHSRRQEWERHKCSRRAEKMEHGGQERS